jgi:phospholipid-binding lipoprotein MlaA
MTLAASLTAAGRASAAEGASAAVDTPPAESGPTAGADLGGSVRSPAASVELSAVFELESEDYDPWQPFNERTFWFNHGVLDRFVLKPAATVWDLALPDPAQRSLGRAFDNLDMPRRLVNNLLQARVRGAARELARFLLNTTAGVGGLLDVAGRLGIRQSEADTGQTLGVYGFGAGPYLVLPFLPPLTVRDGIGYGLDSLLDPLSYVLPGLANTSRSAVSRVNERSLNLLAFQNVEESVLDLYSAVRNGYLQRRRRAIERAG